MPDKIKPWYYSKTLWANILMLIGMFSIRMFGIEFTAEEQGAFIIVINLVLRITTNSGLTK